MKVVSGDVILTVTKTDGKEEEVVVDGTEFGQEESTDWLKDPNDGEWCASFLFIAFCKGFDLMLSIDIHGNGTRNSNLDVRETNFKDFEISSVEIIEDELDVNIPPPSSEEGDY